MDTKTIELKLKELKKTIPFKWRVQRLTPNKQNPTHAFMIAYVDARDVQEHLDTILGASNWSNEFKDLNGRLFCGIGLKINSEWVWKWDRGTETETEKGKGEASDAFKLKGEASDAFKRAAVQWGINRDAYKVGLVKIGVQEHAGKHYPVDENGKWLSGQKLFDKCNALAKIKELQNYSIEITDSYTSDVNHEKNLD